MRRGPRPPPPPLTNSFFFHPAAPRRAAGPGKKMTRPLVPVQSLPYPAAPRHPDHRSLCPCLFPCLFPCAMDPAAESRIMELIHSLGFNSLEVPGLLNSMSSTALVRQLEQEVRRRREAPEPPAPKPRPAAGRRQLNSQPADLLPRPDSVRITGPFARGLYRLKQKMLQGIQIVFDDLNNRKFVARVGNFNSQGFDAVIGYQQKDGHWKKEVSMQGVYFRDGREVLSVPKNTTVYTFRFPECDKSLQQASDQVLLPSEANQRLIIECVMRLADDAVFVDTGSVILSVAALNHVYPGRGIRSLQFALPPN